MNKSQRVAYGEALLDAGRKNENVVVLDADLACSTRGVVFEKEFPERFFNIGIAEANMIGIGAGLASCGRIPFISTFSMFITFRGGDQVRQSIAYPGLNVKLCGINSGISNPGDGATHQDVSDIAVMRSMPNMTVIAPCDAIETKKAVFSMLDYEGPVYMRLCREELPLITDDNDPFIIGKANQLLDGDDITLVTTGSLVFRVINVAKSLKEEGISARVINMHTIKPLDKNLILQAAKETNGIITVEEHNIYGGLGSSIAELLIQECPTPMKIIGIKDEFGQSARNYQELIERYSLSEKDIYNETIKFYNKIEM